MHISIDVSMDTSMDIHIHGNPVYIVTRWSGFGGIEAYLSGQLAYFIALTLPVWSSGL